MLCFVTSDKTKSNSFSSKKQLCSEHYHFINLRQVELSTVWQFDGFSRRRKTLLQVKNHSTELSSPLKVWTSIPSVVPWFNKTQHHNLIRMSAGSLRTEKVKQRMWYDLITAFIYLFIYLAVATRSSHLSPVWGMDVCLHRGRWLSAWLWVKSRGISGEGLRISKSKFPGLLLPIITK